MVHVDEMRPVLPHLKQTVEFGFKLERFDCDDCEAAITSVWLEYGGGREGWNGQVHSNCIVITIARTVYWNLSLRVVYFVCYSSAMATGFLGYQYSSLQSLIGHAKRMT